MLTEMQRQWRKGIAIYRILQVFLQLFPRRLGRPSVILAVPPVCGLSVMMGATPFLWISRISKEKYILMQNCGFGTRREIVLTWHLYYPLSWLKEGFMSLLTNRFCGLEVSEKKVDIFCPECLLQCARLVKWIEFNPIPVLLWNVPFLAGGGVIALPLIFQKLSNVAASGKRRWIDR